MEKQLYEIRMPQMYTPETECCANCRYFVQHYLREQIGENVWLGETFCGHCFYPRVKVRRRTQWCERFERKK